MWQERERAPHRMEQSTHPPLAAAERAAVRALGLFTVISPAIHDSFTQDGWSGRLLNKANMKNHQPSAVFGSLSDRRDIMNPLTKVCWVGAGYVLALAAAAAVVAGHLMLIGGPGNPAYSGMNAFGDSLLFLAVFGVASIPATAAALFFLRPCLAFWRVIKVVAIVVALTSLAAFIGMAIAPLSVAAGVAFIRILVAPVFTLGFLLAGFFAPDRASRIALFVATGIEASGFAGWVINCLLHNLG